MYTCFIYIYKMCTDPARPHGPSRVQVECCFTSTVTIRTIRDVGGGGGGGGAKDGISTVTQLLSYWHVLCV